MSPSTSVIRYLPRRATAALAFWLIGACRNGQEPADAVMWAADLVTRGELLVMRIPREPLTFSSTGSLASLTNVGADPLTLSGTRVADTLDIVFTKSSGAQFHFTGWYVVNRTGISGTLDGGEFAALHVSFRMQ